MLTEADLARMEAEHAATTQGEWEIVRRGRDGHGKRVLKVPGLEYGSCGCCGYDDIADGPDGDFCAAAHRDVPVLIAEVRRLRAILKTVLEHQEAEEGFKGEACLRGNDTA